MTSLYIHDIILDLFKWTIKQDYRKQYLVTIDLSQSKAPDKGLITRIDNKPTYPWKQNKQETRLRAANSKIIRSRNA